jgi:hypothetical protein
MKQPIKESERAEVEWVIRDTIGWALTKDIKRLFSIVAQDEDFFIFHPDSKSTIIGFEAFKNLAESSWMTNAFKATDFAVKELRVNFSTPALVAWYSAILDDHAEWNGKPGGWDNVRWTGVLEKRDGQWVTVQMHFSFATDQIGK